MSRASSNPLLNAGSLPAVARITAAHARPAIDSLLASGRGAIAELLSADAQPYTRDNLIAPLETTLFHEFGHTLHHLLTQVDYAPVSGTNGVAWDAVELPSQFLEHWCWAPESLALISAHQDTGDRLPVALIERLRGARYFRSGLQTLRQVELALTDRRRHLNYDPAQGARIAQTVAATRREVAVLTPPEFNRFMHGFSHIFGGGYAAGYHSYKWAAAHYSVQAIRMGAESPKCVPARRRPRAMASPCQRRQRRMGAFGELPSGALGRGHPRRCASWKGRAISCEARLVASPFATRCAHPYGLDRVLACDAYSRFEERGVMDPATGREFLHAVLEKGGARDALESFKTFRGREPTIDALLGHDELTPAQAPA